MNLVYLTILFPLLGFFLLSFSRGVWRKEFSTLIGVGSIGLSLLISIYVTFDYFINDYVNTSGYVKSLWIWISINTFHIPISFMIDGLSLVMLDIVTSISFCVHLYSSWCMRNDMGYSRFFAYMNLFVANMLILVLADNLLLMYFGWEGVGLCSYLLIGFYYNNSKNGLAALKTFVITRISDVFLMCGLFLLYDQFGTLNFHNLTVLSSQNVVESSTLSCLAILMLIGGSVGKSAQFPLQIWLTDAMVAPAPVSALIHAATMVTSGVYLITRVQCLFLVFPKMLDLVAIIGSITLIMSSICALVQSDLKKILAYSTMSQVGYMFLSIGVQDWYASIYHLMTHSFFKALLFLASGSIILACHNERDIFKMRVSYRSMPLIYVCFLIGGLSLSSFPLITSGFYSKEAILHSVAYMYGNYGIFTVIGLIGSLLTSIYTFRMIFIMFHSEKKIEIYTDYFDIKHNLPLILLLILSTSIGSCINLPLDHYTLSVSCSDVGNSNLILKLVSSSIIVFGIFLAGVLWLLPSRLLYFKYNVTVEWLFFKILYYFDGLNWIYNQVFVKPYLFIAKFLVYDPLNFVFNYLWRLVRLLGFLLVLNDNGNLRWYLLLISLGLLVVVLSLLFL
ncbi:NADH-quinone oxidoreductase subunit L [Blochmannia endosymbiont of Colobopsis nipponica]|uniref:NADH-quinone oxidoreductase subunit L n=1 Tax=Blochmannia endosymbiont of Colobopsis nipponica TaxID=2681987 RepID=UPI00177F38F7|nr:NADH-quinone oxidoreductase subunit L [Blochmannia endosymbiont of Colobopsis nipponica]QOI10982.1 NADH-quinone oxidoreductase subunit L [Blochmannia endosymbiont of Colobopsis nipponica]